MNDKSYQERVKNLTSDMDPKAWEMMEELLDEATDKKVLWYRKWYLLLPFFLFGVSGSIYFLNQPSNRNHNVSFSNTENEKHIDSPINTITTPANSNIEPNGPATIITNSENKKTSSSAAKAWPANKENVQSTKKPTPPIHERDNSSIKSDLAPSEIKDLSKLEKPVDHIHKPNSAFRENEIKRKTTANISGNSEDKTLHDKTASTNGNTKVATLGNAESTKESKAELTNQLIDGGDISDAQHLHQESSRKVFNTSLVKGNDSESRENNNSKQKNKLFEKTPQLPLLSIASMAINSSLPESNLQIKVPRSPKWKGVLGAGPAKFNGNSGYTVTGGLSYELSKLINIEGSLGYSRGKDGTAYQVGPDIRDDESQFDANIFLHLNFIETRKHRLALIIGGGHTMYNGTRRIGTDPISEDTRSSSGRNLGGGIEYNFRFNPSTQLGLKYGAVSYDDSVEFLQFRIYKYL